jgi:hypothetical protein
MRRLVLGVAFLAMAACSNTTDDTVALGLWGGPNAEVTVTASGGTARFKCGATGSIATPLRLTGAAFDAIGTFTPVVVQGGARPAEYKGSVSGNAMTLQLIVAGQDSGTFQLQKDQPGRMDVCNF